MGNLFILTAKTVGPFFSIIPIPNLLSFLIKFFSHLSNSLSLLGFDKSSHSAFFARIKAKLESPPIPIPIKYGGQASISAFLTVSIINSSISSFFTVGGNTLRADFASEPNPLGKIVILSPSVFTKSI